MELEFPCLREYFRNLAKILYTSNIHTASCLECCFPIPGRFVRHIFYRSDPIYSRMVIGLQQGNGSMDLEIAPLMIQQMDTNGSDSSVM